MEWNKNKNEGPCQNVFENDVVKALCNIKAGKTGSPSEVTSEESVKKLKYVANVLLDGKEMPQSWRTSEILPLLNRKEDARCCKSCRSVQLLEHVIKVLENFFEKQLRKQVEINKMQIGFMPRKINSRCNIFGETDDGKV